MIFIPFCSLVGGRIRLFPFCPPFSVLSCKNFKWSPKPYPHDTSGHLLGRKPFLFKFARSVLLVRIL